MSVRVPILVACAALAAAMSGPVAAAEPEKPFCSGLRPLGDEGFRAPELRVVAPDAPARTRFHKDGYNGEGCPAATAACAEKAFVTPGDPVIVTATVNGFGCATFTGPAPKAVSTIGFLELSSLASPSQAQPAADWAGAWRSGPEKRITLTAAGAAFAIKGDATFGAQDPERVERGAVNIGEIEAKASPKGAEMGFAMGDDGETLPFDAAKKSDSDFCRVRMWRLGPYLVVADNGMCGGMNVTFTGVYRRP